MEGRVPIVNIKFSYRAERSPYTRVVEHDIEASKCVDGQFRHSCDITFY